MIAMLSILGIAGCRKTPSNTPNPSTPSEKTPITLTKLEIANKDELTGFHYVDSEDATLRITVDEGKNVNDLIASKDIKIASSNDKVAMVLGQRIVFKGVGDVKITITGGGKEDSVSFYVGNPVTLVPEDTAVGKAGTMKVAVESEKNGSDAALYDWSSSDETKATVDATGLVTGVAVGEVTIFAKLKTNAKEGAAITIKVEESVAQPVAINTLAKSTKSTTTRGEIVAKYASGFVIDDGTGAIVVYQKTTLAIGDVVKVTSSEVSVYHNMLELSGKVTVVKVGYKVAKVQDPVDLTVDIAKKFATSKDNGSDSINLTKKYRWNAVATKAGSHLCLNLNGWNVPIQPTGMDEKAFPYTEGKYYAIEGYWAGYSSSSGGYVNMVITKLEETAPEVTQVTLSASKDTMEVETAKTFTAAVLKSAADKDANAVWSSSNEAFATVDQTGKVTAVAAGTATITCTVGGGHADLTITVINKLETSALSAVTEDKKLYKVRGLIGAVSKKSFVITDGAASLRVSVLDTNLLTEHKTGEFIEVLAAANVCNGQVSFYQVQTCDITFITENIPENQELTAIDLTKEIADGLVSTGDTPVSSHKLYKWTTKVVKSGKNLTFPVDGSSTVIEATESDTANIKEGSTYDVEGYFTGYNKNKFADFVFTKVTKVIKNEIVFAKDNTTINLGEKADITFSWNLVKDVDPKDVVLSFTSENAEIATATRDGSVVSVTAVAVGKTAIVGTIKKAEAVLAEARLEVEVVDPAASNSITIDSAGLGLANKYQDTTAVIKDVSWTAYQVSDYGDGIQMRDGNKNDPSILPSCVYNTTALPKAIKNVVINFNAKTIGRYNNTKVVSVTTGNEAITASGTVALAESTELEVTYTPASTTDTFVNVGHIKSKGVVYINSIVINFVD